MKTVLALCLFAATAAAQQYGAGMVSSYGGTYGKVLTTPIPILKFDQTIRDNGHDSLYETGNGIKNQETTDLVQGPAREVINEYGQKAMSSTYVKKSGSYSYTNADGTVTAISYTADENGFHPVGDHLPVAPQLPAEYAKPVREMQQYAAPQSYEAPAVRMQSSYEAPTVRTQSSYAQSSYAPSAPSQSIRFNYAK